MKFVIFILLLAVVAAGCASRSGENAKLQAAYLAGQKAAFATMTAAQRTSVVVIGPVQNPEIQWTDGLTLAQAIATATYTGFGEPKEIILLRQGERASISPKDLLHGKDVPLEPGDTITIHE